VTIVEPGESFSGFSTKFVTNKELSFSAISTVKNINPGETLEYGFTVYCGPQKLDTLKKLEMAMRRSLCLVVGAGLMRLLN